MAPPDELPAPSAPTKRSPLLAWSLASLIGFPLLAILLPSIHPAKQPELVRYESLLLLARVILFVAGALGGVPFAFAAGFRLRRSRSKLAGLRIPTDGTSFFFLLLLAILLSILSEHLWQTRQTVMLSRCVWNRSANNNAIALWTAESGKPDSTIDLPRIERHWKTLKPPGYLFNKCPNWPWPAYTFDPVEREVRCPDHP